MRLRQLSKWSVWFLVGVLLQTLSLAPVGFAKRYAPEINQQAIEDDGPAPEMVSTPVQDLIPPLAAPAPQKADVQADNDATVPTLKGNVDIEKPFVPDITFDSGHTLAAGDQLDLIIMDMVATGYTEVGDAFNARVKTAVERGGKILIPRGALIKGHITEVDEPGSALAQRGKMMLTFDYILMPDGRKVPFKSKYLDGDTHMRAMGRTMAAGLGGSLTGAASGVITGLKFGGLAGAALTHGATLIAGGGLGALGGLGTGLARGGDHVILNEGDEIKVSLQQPLTLPGMTMAPDTDREIHAPGLTVDVLGYQLGRDPFKIEDMINLTLKIDNQTDYQFGSFDMVLVDEYNTAYNITPFGEGDTLIFQIPPRSTLSNQFSFQVKSPELHHYLVFYKPYTREVIAKISLTEALKKLAINPKSGRHS